MMSLRLLRPHRVRVCPVGYWDLWEPQRLTRVRVPVVFRDDFVESFFNDFFGISSKSETENDKTDKSAKNYTMKLPLKDFRPEDIKVKVQGQDLLVEARHEEKKEDEEMFSHNFRELRRRFHLPENVDKKNLTSAFARDGTLEIEAPILPEIEDKKPDAETAEKSVEDPEQKSDIEVTHAKKE